MVPGEQTLTEIPDAPSYAANPVNIGFSLVLAFVLAYVVAYLLRRQDLPLPPPPPTDAPVPVIPAATPPHTAVAPTPEPPPPAPVQSAPSLYGMLQSALARSREVLQGGFDRVFGKPIDAASLDELEEILLRADVGVQTTGVLMAKVRSGAAANGPEPDALREVLKGEMRRMLTEVHQPLAPRDGLWVVLVVGVNGSGKTTTIGKLAARLREQGRRVLVAAGDTFRAAAEQQLGVWADRAGVDIVALEQGADPGAVAFTAVERAKSQGYDVVLVDTAGRLQTKKPLMEQLGKVRRVLDKALPGAPHETLLVVDGTMGQNAMSQAKLFHEVTQVTGVVVTKLDGTAKGGMVLAIATELKLPVKLVGLGERAQDLREFDPQAFVDALV